MYIHLSLKALLFNCCLRPLRQDATLRDLLRRQRGSGTGGGSGGLHLGTVQAYAKQLLAALEHLRRCGLVHADVQPDNIL